MRSMFSTIAPTYDRLNRIISLRLDQRWRRLAIAQLDWQRAPGGIYLDLCAGTMDFSAILAVQPGFRGRIAGADFAQPMLAHGRHKTDRAVPVTSDALALPFADASFDGAMLGWGARNFEDLDAGLIEAARVLAPGARLVMLDMSTPSAQPLRGIFRAYFEHVLPRIGRLISKHRSAYSWLPESTRVFPEPAALARRLEQAGFRDVSFSRFLGGVTALHVATRV
ncbi:MAG: ubiquinone/menaquinone biosynthesis methyltransferase [Gemmatimonadales bacterium]|nr:ubiquinone/menaquinone biosynthesis methyltransferase [Gemmatimonadales bacterium]